MNPVSRWTTLSTVVALAGVPGCTPDISCVGGWCGTLVVSSAPVRSLVPPLAYWDVDVGLADLLFAKLADLGADLNTAGDVGFVPKLAQTWEFEDSLTISFSLNPGARWHDGTPVTAQDVAFTFDVYRNPSVNALARPRLDEIESVTIRDSKTVVFQFSRYYQEQFFDAVHHMHIIPHHVLGTVAPEDLRSHAFTLEPIGCGPYKLAGWRPGEVVDLLADSTFFLGRPGVPRILWRSAAGPTAAIDELVANTVDFTHAVLEPSDVERIANESHLRLVEYPSNTYYHVAFNLRDPENPDLPHPLLGDRNLRRAIVTTVDRSALIDGLVGEHGLRSVGPVTPALWVWSEDLPEGLPCDTAQARMQFEQLGWHDTDGDGVLDRDGRQLALELLVRPVASHTRGAVILQEQMRRLGIRVDIEELETAAYVDRLSSGQFDAHYNVLGLDPSPASIGDWSEAGFGVFNYGKYSNPEFTRLVQEAINATNRTSALTKWREALGIINEDAPAIWLYIPRKRAVVHERFENVSVRPDQPWAMIPDWRVSPSRLIDRDLYGGH